MIFDWFRKKKNNSKESSDTGIITEDSLNISFIRIPKYEELTDEEKILAIDDFNKLIQDNEYDTILKFSKELVDISNRERLILSRTLNRYYELFKKNNNPIFSDSAEERIANSVCYSILSNMEFSIIINKLKEIDRRLKIKAVAIELFIEKQSNEKKSLWKILSHKDRLKRDELTNRLQSELRRLKISIKNNDDILKTVDIDIAENETLKKEYELFQKISNKSVSNINVFCSKLVRNSLAEILYNIYRSICFYKYKAEWSLPDLRTPIDSRLTEFLIKIFDNRKPQGITIDGEKYEVNEKSMRMLVFEIWNNTKKMINIVPDENMKELFEIIADWQHSIEIYCYQYRDFFLNCIQEMNNIIDEFENTPTMNWDKERLYGLISKYNGIISYTEKLLENMLGREKNDELIDTYNRLWFLPQPTKREKYLDVFGESIRENTSVLLTKVEDKYGIKMIIPKKLKEEFSGERHWYKKYENRDYLIHNLFITYSRHHSLMYLYDILQGNTDVIKTYIVIKNSNLVARLKRRILSANYGELMPIDEFFHIMKFIGMDPESVIEECEIVIDSSETEFKGPYGYIVYNNFISQIRISELEKRYDDRILIIPDVISVEQAINNRIRPASSIEVVYVSQTKHIDYIKSFINDFTGLKFIFIRFSIAIEYSLGDFFKEKNIAVFLVPDDITYEGLSSYLDEVEKVKSQSLILTH